MAEPSGDIPEGFEPLPGKDTFIHHAGPVYWGEADGQFVLGFRVTDRHLNPAGMAAGGLLMTAMDLGLIIGLIAAKPDGGFSPTTSLSVDFLAPAWKGDWIESRVDFVHATTRRAVASGRLIGPKGVVLRGNGTFSFPREGAQQYQTSGPNLRAAILERQKQKKP